MTREEIINELDKLEDRIVSFTKKIANIIGDSDAIYDKKTKQCKNNLIYCVREKYIGDCPFDIDIYNDILKSNDKYENYNFDNSMVEIYFNINEKLFKEEININNNLELMNFKIASEKYLNIAKKFNCNEKVYLGFNNSSFFNSIYISNDSRNFIYKILYDNIKDIPNDIFNKEIFVEVFKDYFNREVNNLRKKLKENLIDIPETRNLRNFVIVSKNFLKRKSSLYKSMNDLEVLNLDTNSMTLEKLNEIGQLEDEEFFILKGKLEKYYDGNYTLIPKEQYNKIVEYI